MNCCEISFACTLVIYCFYVLGVKHNIFVSTCRLFVFSCKANHLTAIIHLTCPHKDLASQVPAQILRQNKGKCAFVKSQVIFLTKQ